MRSTHRRSLAPRRLTLSTIILTAALSGSGCNNAGQGALTGAGAGALGGLAIGSLYGQAGTGAVIGAVAGGAAGAVLGDQNERHASRCDDGW